MFEEKIKQLEFEIKMLKNDKEILRAALIEAQIKLGKDTKPNFIDRVLKITK